MRGFIRGFADTFLFVSCDCMPKISTLILLFLFVSCKTELKKTISTFRNGKPAVQIIFNDKTDTTSGQILQYYTDGKIYKKATIYKKRYVDRKVTYYSSGQISQIDSLSQPCDLNIDQCNGTVIRYHENGNISQRYSVNNHELNGMTQQFT